MRFADHGEGGEALQDGGGGGEGGHGGGEGVDAGGGEGAVGGLGGGRHVDYACADGEGGCAGVCNRSGGFAAEGVGEVRRGIEAGAEILGVLVTSRSRKEGGCN